MAEDAATSAELEQLEVEIAALEEKRAALRARVEGPGAIAQGPGSVAAVAGGQVAVGGDVLGDVIVVNAARPEPMDPDRVLGGSETPDLRAAAERYLRYLVEVYQYLDFRGMGISDRVPLRLPLLEMYVPLRARIEMPEGDTWAKELRLAGRRVGEEEAEAIGRKVSEPVPVLDLLGRHDGLIVLGDPGAGKTTFLKYLALTVATGDGESVGLGDRLPVLLPLSAYAAALEEEEVPVDRFLLRYHRGRGVGGAMEELLGQVLERGSALVLLDGLDEVRERSHRHRVVDRVKDFYSLHRGAGNKFVLTSRVVGYREVRPEAEGLAECTLVDFDEEEMGAFVGKWTSALERAASGATEVAAEQAELERRELLSAVRHNPGVRALASNPLLLTILALMKRQGVALPERRVELYEKYVETLLKHWNLARGLDRGSARDLDVGATLRVLAPLALWMHETSPGVGLVKEQEVRRELERIFGERGAGDPERAGQAFLADVREHASLLLDRGGRQYGFIHLTFQEYLAAVALAQKGQQSIEPVVEALSAHVGEDTWHEVIRLTIGYLGIVQQRDEAASAVVGELLARAPGAPGQAAVVAGRAVADVCPGGITEECREETVSALLEALGAGRVAPPLRAAVGRSLAALGDPRREVMTVDGMEFCRVPAGRFLMGSDDEDELAYGDEKPQHRLEIPYDFRLGRYPVTVAQFREFVDATGHEHDERLFDDPLNQPVRWVSWFDAVEFCRWLSNRWRSQGWLAEDWEVRLPSEAEWEKGARGGLEAPDEPVVTTAAGSAGRPKLVANREPLRRYPWGQDPDPGRANCQGRIGRPSAVGCFPGGVSPYGCEELSGNLWEWTRTIWGEKWDQPAYEYPYDPMDGRESSEDLERLRVVRGGAFRDLRRDVRCAFRGRPDPHYRWNYGGFRVALSPFSLNSEISEL